MLKCSFIRRARPHVLSFAFTSIVATTDSKTFDEEQTVLAHSAKLLHILVKKQDFKRSVVFHVLSTTPTKHAVLSLLEVLPFRNSRVTKRPV